MRTGTPRTVLPVGDRALLVACAGLDEVLALDAELRLHPVAGQRDLQPAERSLLVVLDGARSQARAARALAALDAPPAARDRGRRVEIEVVYDGADLDDVAAHAGLSRDAVVAAHTATAWTAAFSGFAPGFVYLVGDVPPVPRRDVPRTSVPAGAVAVGGPYSAVYPRRSPGGWRLLGRTDTVLWDAAADPPALLRPGDVVRFRAVRAAIAGGAAGAGTPGRRDAGGRPGRLAHARARPPAGAAAPTAFTVVAPGALTLIEDLGRPGRRDVGVGPGGAADRGAARAANRLVGNARSAAVLETVLGGLTLRAERAVVVALTGAARHLEVQRAGGGTALVPAGTPTAVAVGDLVRVPPPGTGLRSYLAVRGGVDAVVELGSRATDVLSGLGPAPLAAGAAVPVGDAVDGAVGEPVPVEPPEGGSVTLRAVAGPDAPGDTPAGDVTLWDGAWTVAEASNRVGVRLTGAPLPVEGSGTRPSAGMVAGAVQVPPSGEPVVFGVDHPVTGGYPVVAVVVDADLDRLAQLRPGQLVRFVPAPGTALPPVDTTEPVPDA